MEYPNPEKHQHISFIKSFIRMVGYGLLVVNIPISIALLITAEVIGIYEELV